jgi:hypothetical protein
LTDAFQLEFGQHAEGSTKKEKIRCPEVPKPNRNNLLMDSQGN